MHSITVCEQPAYSPKGPWINWPYILAFCQKFAAFCSFFINFDRLQQKVDQNTHQILLLPYDIKLFRRSISKKVIHFDFYLNFLWQMSWVFMFLVWIFKMIRHFQFCPWLSNLNFAPPLKISVSFFSLLLVCIIVRLMCVDQFYVWNFKRFCLYRME